MKLLLLILTGISLSIGFLFSPIITLAANDSGTTSTNLPNPLSGDLTLSQEEDAQKAVMFFQERLVTLIAIVFRLLAVGSMIPILVGGMQLMISRGGDYAKKGKSTLYWGLVGLVTAFIGVFIFDYLLVIFLPQ